MNNYRYFMWDWKDSAPLKDIVECTKKNLDWHVYGLDWDSDGLIAIMAPSQEMAELAVQDIFSASIEDAADDPDDNWTPPSVILWSE
jgi:hypothetical protein